MILDWHRISSLGVAFFYVGGACWLEGGEIACKALVFTILPLACIWFSESMGNATGMLDSISINQESPGVIIRWLGWVLLLLPIILAGFQVFHHGRS
jgi:hypothetical protein